MHDIAINRIMTTSPATIGPDEPAAADTVNFRRAELLREIMVANGDGDKQAMITEGGTVVWKDGAYVKGVAGIAAGKQEVECYTFDVGSGQYQFTVE